MPAWPVFTVEKNRHASVSNGPTRHRVQSVRTLDGCGLSLRGCEGPGICQALRKVVGGGTEVRMTTVSVGFISLC